TPGGTAAPAGTSGRITREGDPRMSLPRNVMIGMAAAMLAVSTAACGSSASKTSAGSGGSGGGGGGASTVKIMVGGLDKQIYLPVMLTQQLGYFKDQGLNVQLSDEPAG